MKYELLLYVVPGNIAVLYRLEEGFEFPKAEKVTPAGGAPFGHPEKIDPAAQGEPSWHFGLEERSFYVKQGRVRVVWPAGMPAPPAGWVEASVQRLSRGAPS